MELTHKHVPEMKKYSRLKHAPMFVPSVGHYAQGMLVMVPITRDIVAKKVSAKDVHGVLADYYAGETFVPVRPLADRKWLERDRFLRADRLVDTNTMELAVYGNEAEEQILAVASLDNLGKGASGAAVQCINLKTGVDETTGLAVAAKRTLPLRVPRESTRRLHANGKSAEARSASARMPLHAACGWTHAEPGEEAGVTRHRQARRLVDAGLEVDALHRRTRCALAEVVERGDGQDLLLGLVAVDGELHGVGVDQPVGPEEPVALQPLAVGERPHRHEGLAGIVVGEHAVHVLGAHLLGHDVGGDRHHDQHALGVVADRGHEHRRVLQVRVLLHLRHMLVRELQPIDAERLDAGLLVDGDKLLAAAGVARDAEHGGHRIGGTMPASTSGRRMAMAPVG